MKTEKERLKTSIKNNQKKDLMYIDSIKNSNVLSASEKKEFQNLWGKYEKARKNFEENFNIYTGQITTFKEQLHIKYRGKRWRILKILQKNCG